MYVLCMRRLLLEEYLRSKMRTYIFPQPLEKLGVLPIKLRGGLGQRPEPWNQVPQESTLKGSALRSFQVPQNFHVNVQVPQASTSRFQVSQGFQIKALKIKGSE